MTPSFIRCLPHQARALSPAGRWLRVAIFAALLSLGSTAAYAMVSVNPAIDITHTVTVQLIQTAEDDGDPLATVFGSATSREYIEEQVDRVWAQAGIDVQIIPEITQWNDTWAFQGSGGFRPQNDLAGIINNGNTAEVTATDPSIINVFFVDVVPGFGVQPQNTANALANIGNNGIAMHVGDSLVTFQNGRNVIASVLAHEIGHNLGLKHTANGTDNLLVPNASSGKLTQAQIDAVFSTTAVDNSTAFIPNGGTGFLVPVEPVILEGDFNEDGVVDAADYSTWRAGLGTEYTEADFAVWRSNFGLSNDASAGGTGAGSNGFVCSHGFFICSLCSGGHGHVGVLARLSIPEPATALLVAAAIVGIGCFTNRRS